MAFLAAQADNADYNNNADNADQLKIKADFHRDSFAILAMLALHIVLFYLAYISEHSKSARQATSRTKHKSEKITGKYSNNFHFFLFGVFKLILNVVPCSLVLQGVTEYGKCLETWKWQKRYEQGAPNDLLYV